MLTVEQKMKWQASALTFLTRYSEQGDDFLSCIVAGRDIGIARNPRIETSVHGMEAHIIANKEKIQTDHFNLQDHVHSVLGQKRRYT
jgi:hypothetical protein